MICLMCGRTLKGEKSIERGYGPICYRKIKPTSSTRTHGSKSYSLADDVNYAVPGQIELSEFIDMTGGNHD